MPTATPTQPGPLSSEQRASLQQSIEAAVVAHANLVDTPDAEADNALRLLSASSLPLAPARVVRLGATAAEGLSTTPERAGRRWSGAGCSRLLAAADSASLRTVEGAATR